MPHTEPAADGRMDKELGRTKGKNQKKLIPDDQKPKSLPAHDRSSQSKEIIESLPNNLGFYDWQPSCVMEKPCKTKKRNEDREPAKRSYQHNYRLSEGCDEPSNLKIVNQRMTTGQTDRCVARNMSGQLAGNQHHLQMLSDLDLTQSKETRNGKNLSENEAELPNPDDLVDRLSSLQNSIKQASIMLEKIRILPEPQQSEQKAHLLSILGRLKEEEYGYKVLLRGIMTTQEVSDGLQNALTGIYHSSDSDIGQKMMATDYVNDGAATGTVPGDDENSTVAESETSAVSVQRRHLEEKLQTLQEKKQQMDELLGKLQRLKLEQSILDDDVKVAPILNSLRAASSADQTKKDAEEMLMKMETRHKLKKLKTMRDQLEQLRALSQLFQNASNRDSSLDCATMADYFPDDNDDDDDDDDDDDEAKRDDEGEDSTAYEAAVHFMRAQSENELQNGNVKASARKNLTAGFNEHRKVEPVTCEERVSRSDVTDEVAEKMRQLEAASDKLQQLQQMVAMVQQSEMPEDLELEDLAGNNGMDQKPVSDTENEKQRDDEEFYAQKMKEQQKELQALMEERQRLLKLRADLDKIQENIPEGSINEKSQSTELSDRVPHPVGGIWVSRESRNGTVSKRSGGHTAQPGVQEAVQVTFQEPVESVVSNEEVYDQMRWQRMMREELREKKDRKCRMNGTTVPKHFSSVHDGHSENSTYRSDQFRTSPSEDITMGTWGGSTSANLESIDENENRSNNEVVDESDDNENEKDNEEEEEDDDDNDSGGLMQAEEEEEEEDDALNDVIDDSYKDDDVDAAPTHRWKLLSENGSVQQRAGSENNLDLRIHCNGQRRWRKKQEGVDLSIVRESICSLKKQVTELTTAVKKSLRHSRTDRNVSPMDQTVQLQQNQLFLGLNQSYFQLVATQNDMMERFSRLEQFVLHSQSDLSKELYPGSEKSGSPHPANAHDGSFVAPGVSVSQPSVAKHCASKFEKNFGNCAAASDFVDRRWVLNKKDSPKIREMGEFLRGDNCRTEACEFNESYVRQSKDRGKERALSSEQLSARAALWLNAPKSSRLDAGEDVVIRQQNSVMGRAFAMAHMASQKVVDVKDDERLLSTIADDVSVSSVPGSCSEPVQKLEMDDQYRSSTSNGFERLSDEIYSEVASLISQNEQCPDFLIQLFRKLQCLSTDFLRQRALYVLQDLVSLSANTAESPFIYGSSSANMTSGPGQNDQKQLVREESTGLSSDQSTPSPCNTSHWENPFERDPLGDTVIHFDKMLHSVRDSEAKFAEAQHASLGNSADADGVVARESEDIFEAPVKWTHQSSKQVASARAQRNEKCSDGSVSDEMCPPIDAHCLDRQIKEIMLEVIPVIKDNIGGICSKELLQYIEELVFSLIHQTNHSQPEFVQFFNRQLATILKDSLVKFEGRKILECGEDLLVDLSEILFNELAFFRMMQNLDQSKAKVRAKLLTWRKDTSSITSSDHIQKRKKAQVNMPDSSSDSNGSSESSESDMESLNPKDEAENVNKFEKSNCTDELKQKNDDEKYYQLRNPLEEKDMSNCDAESTGVDDYLEEDEYYTENLKFMKDAESIDDSFSMDDSFCNSNVRIELAPSETKPFTRIGSDEDDETVDEAASADDPHETAVSMDAEKERCSKASTSSATRSSSSLEQESFCKGSTEGEEKEKDTKELELSAAENDDKVAESVVENSNGEVPNNERQMVNAESCEDTNQLDPAENRD